MLSKLFIGITFLAAAIFSSTTFAEDAIDADPEHYTVEFENDKVRIIRIKYGAGEKSVMHTHGPHVWVALSATTFRMTVPDGTSREDTSGIGDAGWSDAHEHLPENLSDEPAEVLLVELKE